MPDSPDFDEIALRLWNDGEGCNMPYIEEQLRQVWNARGAADEEAVLVEFRGPTPECLRAAGAIRILDR